MQVRLTIQFLIVNILTGEPQAFSRKFDADLVQVPRVGEAVIIPGADSGSHLGARRVDDVIYSIDGQLVLTFNPVELGKTNDERAKALRSAGYLD
jgi:hypothetical protein